MNISKELEKKVNDARLVLQIEQDKNLTNSQAIEILVDRFMSNTKVLDGDSIVNDNDEFRV